MTMTPDSQSPQTPVPAAPGRSWLPYVMVAALSLAIGAGAMFWLVRGRSLGAGAAASEHAGHAATADVPQEAPPSDKAVYISAARQQLIGVRTAKVGYQRLETTIRTVGVLAYDETRLAVIHTKTAGWVESVAVDFVGKSVTRGQPLFTVYSPDLVASQKEYLLALKAREQLGASAIPETRDSAAALLAASRQRLRLWDMTDEQVADLERTREPRKNLTVYSPATGTVLERNVYPGQYITPEVGTLKIADLSTIWVLGQIFEYELPMVKLGQAVEVEFPHGESSQTLHGTVSFIYPDIDPTTRRVKVRIVLPNPGFVLKPETYVTVVVQTGAGRQLAVPKEAVIDDGLRQYVILSQANGYFEPRMIKTGQAVDEYYAVMNGLADGDVIVTSAQFLIDSETNLQAAMQSMAGGEAASAMPAASPAGPTPTPAVLDIAFRIQPDPPRVGENALEVSVKDAQGRPVTDGEVSVAFFMPPMASMGMPAMRNSATLQHAENGVYRGTGEVLMAGRWDVTVTVSRAGQRAGSKRLAIVVK